MVNRLYRDMNYSLSKVRIESYRQPGQSDLDVIATYLWNTALAESLHPALQAVEVSLRNTIDRTINERHRQRVSAEHSWLLEPAYFQRRQLNDLKDIRKRYHDRGFGSRFSVNGTSASSGND